MKATKEEILTSADFVRVEVERIVTAINQIDCEKVKEHLARFNPSNVHLLDELDLNHREFHEGMSKAVSMLYVFHDIKHLCQKIADAKTADECKKIIVLFQARMEVVNL